VPLSVSPTAAAVPIGVAAGLESTSASSMVAWSVSVDSATIGFTSDLGFFGPKLNQFYFNFQNSRILRATHVVGNPLLKHHEEGKMATLEDVDFTIEQKKVVEDELELAHEKMRKMEESMKNIEEDNKKIQDESIQFELQVADTVDEYKDKANEKRLKTRKIRKHAVRKKFAFNMHLVQL
jgi:hypothetical protein